MQHAARSSAIRRSQLRSQGTRQESLGKMRENISRATDHTTFNNWQCASNVAFSVYPSCHLCLSLTWPFISLHKIAFAALPTIVNVILTADSPQTPSLTNARRKIISLGQQIVGLLFLCLYILILFIFFYCTNKPLFFPWYFIIFVLALKFCTLWIFFWVLRGYTCRGLTKQSPRSPAVFGQCRVPNFILHLGSNRCTIKK